MSGAEAWTPAAIADALVTVSGLATGVLIGGAALVGWYVWCRWGRRVERE